MRTKRGMCLLILLVLGLPAGIALGHENEPENPDKPAKVKRNDKAEDKDKAGDGEISDPIRQRMSRPHQGEEPDQITFMVSVLDIDEIFGARQSFTANVAIRLTWKDERLAHDGDQAISIPLDEVWDPQIMLVNRQALMRSHLEKMVEVSPDGTVIYRQQYVGPLSQPLTLRDFPLDVQDFNIHFASRGQGAEELEFLPETGTSRKSEAAKMADVLSLPDWEILEYSAEPKELEITDMRNLPGFVFTFIAKRIITYYIWQVIFPLILIVMMSWGPFWIDPRRAEIQVGLASSAVLTLIAYRFLLASLLPKLPYLTRMDFVTLSSTIVVFAAFLQVTVTTIMAAKGHMKTALWTDYVSRVVFPGMFAAMLVWSLFL